MLERYERINRGAVKWEVQSLPFILDGCPKCIAGYPSVVQRV